LEPRLIPVNAVIALCTPGDVYPATLAAAGYRVTGVEVPSPAGEGTVVIDAVLFNAVHNDVLAAEAKSGANVDEAQAKKYGALAADDVVRASSINVVEKGPRSLQPVYVCLAEHVERVLRGLGKAEVAFPVLAVGIDQVTHHGAAFGDSTLDLAFHEPVSVPGFPPRFIPVDPESSDEEFDRTVMPALVRMLSREREQISGAALAEEGIQHLVLYGKRARNQIISKVEAAARRAAERDPATFEYNGRTANRDAIVRFVRAPEATARQGRTQVYQAIARAAGKPVRRSTSSDQMALFDELIDELDEAGDADGDGADDGEEEAGE